MEALTLEIKRIPITDPFLRTTAPPFVFFEKKDEQADYLAFASYLEKEACGYAVFTMEADSPIVRLRYLFTVPPHRKEGIAKELLAHSFQYFQKRKKEAVSCRVISTPDEIGALDDVLYQCGFLPLALLTRFFVYESADLLRDRPDPAGSPFPFLVRGKMVYIFLEDETGYDDKTLIGRLYASLAEAEKTAGIDFRIMLQFTTAETFRLLAENFGEPEEQCLIHDLCYLLGETNGRKQV